MRNNECSQKQIIKKDFQQLLADCLSCSNNQGLTKRHVLSVAVFFLDKTGRRAGLARDMPVEGRSWAGALARRWRIFPKPRSQPGHVGEVHAAGTHCVLLLGESLNPDGLAEVGPFVWLSL